MFAIFVAAGLGVLATPGSGGISGAPALAALQSLSSAIGLRSPGARDPGAVAKSPKLAAERLDQVTFRVPDESNRRRLAPREPDFLSPADVPVGIGTTPDFAAFDLPGVTTLGDGPLAIVGPLPGGPGIIGGGGSIGGGGGGVVVDVPPVSAVPEPGNWAMMIIGFGAIGARLRRRRSGLRLNA